MLSMYYRKQLKKLQEIHHKQKEKTMKNNPYLQSFAKVFSLSVMLFVAVVLAFFVLFAASSEANAQTPKVKEKKPVVEVMTLDMYCLKRADFREFIKDHNLVKKTDAMIADGTGGEVYANMLVTEKIVDKYKKSRYTFLIGETSSCLVFQEEIEMKNQL